MNPNQTKPPLICEIEGSNILQITVPGAPGKVIGVVKAAFDEAVNIGNSYYDKLVEAGIIEREKSPEERHKELMQAIGTLSGKLETLEDNVSKLSLRTQKLEERKHGNQPPNHSPNRQTNAT